MAERFRLGEKSYSRQQMEAAAKANPRRRRNKPAGVFRDIPAGSEDEIQALFFQWLDRYISRFKVLELFHAIPNGAHLTKFGRYVGSITGRRSGVPDTHLPWPAQDGTTARNLWIEFKTPDGSLRPEQKKWCIALREAGDRVEVLRSWTDAANLTIDYLNLPLEKL